MEFAGISYVEGVETVFFHSLNVWMFLDVCV